jgi:hypothetical protein
MRRILSIVLAAIVLKTGGGTAHCRPRTRRMLTPGARKAFPGLNFDQTAKVLKGQR